jgi:hypothetical protein
MQGWKLSEFWVPTKHFRYYTRFQQDVKIFSNEILASSITFNPLRLSSNYMNHLL